jgi:hypothetical protein
MPTDLLDQLVYLPVRRKSRHPVFRPEVLDHVKRVAPDRPGGT